MSKGGNFSYKDVPAGYIHTHRTKVRCERCQAHLDYGYEALMEKLDDFIDAPMLCCTCYNIYGRKDYLLYVDIKHGRIVLSSDVKTLTINLFTGYKSQRMLGVISEVFMPIDYEKIRRGVFRARKNMGFFKGKVYQDKRNRSSNNG